MERDYKVYITYARFRLPNPLWLYGWFLIGLGAVKEFNGLSSEFVSSCQLMLTEDKLGPPSKTRFWFFPKHKLNFIQYYWTRKWKRNNV